MSVPNRYRVRVAGACVLAVACGDPTDPADLIPASIEVTPSAVTLAAVGEVMQLAATVRNRNGEVITGETLVWASADTPVARVDGTGLLTAIHNGNTIISAASENGVVGKAAVTVAQLASEIRLSLTVDTLRALEDTLWIAATVLDAKGNLIVEPELTWSSSFDSVATVDTNGFVLAVGNGNAEITAASGPATASATVTVAQRAAEVQLSGEADTLAALDDTLRLVAEVFDANGHPVADAGITWSSSDESVATVDARGLVTAVGNGSAKIAAASEPATASAEVAVAQRAAEVRLSPEPGTLTSLDDTVRLVAEVLDGNWHQIAGAVVTWSSGDESVATVDADGLVTAVGNGSTEVTAASGSAMRGAKVTVAQVPAETRLSAPRDTLTALDDTVRLVAEAFDANGHPIVDAGFGWSSGDESVTTVDDTGLVTAVKNGSTAITAVSGSATGIMTVTVAQQPTQMRLSPEPETLTALDDTLRLVAEPLDANGHPVADAGVTWSSGDESVARVDRTGLVTAVGNGSTEITAVAGAAAATGAVAVAQRTATMRLLPEQGTLEALEDTLSLFAEAFDRNGYLIAGAVLTWSSTDESVATVDGWGLVVAVSNGSTTVSAVSGSVKRSATVTVAQVTAKTRLSASPGPLTALDETMRLVAQASDANGHAIVDAGFVWSIRDESVATVDNNGLVTAAGNGSTVVTAVSGSASGTTTVTVEQRAAEIRLSPEPETLEALDDTLRLVADAFDANGHPVADAGITWLSSDESVASVEPAGLVTAVGNGSTEIAAASGTAGASTTVTVAQRVAEMRLSPEPDTLTALDDTLRLVAEAFDPNGHPVAGAAVTWSSGDESVATVDGAGLVVAVGNGSTTVSAVSASVVASVTATVAQSAAVVAVSPASHTLTALDDTVRLVAHIVDANGHAMTDVDLTWSSSDESVAIVPGGGLVIAWKNGTTTIKAVADTLAGSATVTVAQQVARIQVSPESLTLTLNSSEHLVAKAFDANGYPTPDPAATWSSGDAEVATVDRAGVVTAVGIGNTQVRAVSGEVEGSADVSVTYRIRVSPDSTWFTALADTVRLIAESIDENGEAIEEVDATWSSNDTTVVTVDSAGLVTAVDNGSAQITATAGSVIASATIWVFAKADTLLVTPDNATLKRGDTLQLAAEVVDANGHPIAGFVFTWSSDDAGVATVDSTGRVVSIQGGSVEIAAEAEGTDLTGVASILVTEYRIRVSPDSAGFTALADTVRLIAESIDENGEAIEEVDASWSSSSEAVVTVDSAGLVTAVGNGSAQITATAGSVEASATIEVSQEADTLLVTPDNATLERGEDLQLVAEVVDANGYPIAGFVFTWSSDDAGVATVDSTGRVVSIQDGSVEISAEAEDTDLTGVASILVTEYRIRVSPDSAGFTALADTVRLIAESIDENGEAIEEVDASWSSSSEAVVTVDSAGLVTAVGNGSAQITATAGSVEASATIEVSQEADTLLVTPDNATLERGEDLQLVAEVVDANGYPIAGFVFTWSSDDAGVATVDSTGRVVSIQDGSVEISAEAEDTDLTGVASILVTEYRIRVSPDSAGFTALADTVRLIAESIDENGEAIEEVDASWSSSSEAVVTVDSAGLVTAVGNGSAQITATAGSVEASATIEVSQEADTLLVTPDNATLERGDTLQLAADVVDANGHPIAGFVFTWSSDDAGVATVDSTGRVVSIQGGSVEIAAEAEGTDLTGVASILVTEYRIRVSPDSAGFTALADTVRLIAESIDENGEAIEEVDASWSSSSEAVVTVDSAGLVTAVGNGSAQITATAGSVEASATIEVSQEADTLLVTPDNATLERGEDLQLVADVVDANGHPIAGFVFTWSSDDDSVATVNSTGLVVSKREGSVEISAEAQGTALTGVASILVEADREKSIRAILAQLYSETGGPDWTSNDNWLTDMPLGSWHGVKVDDEGQMTELLLGENGLTGTIPGELGQLSTLVRLDLQRNDLSGSIPPELAELGNLLELRLYENELTGSIPPELGQMSKLVRLDLDVNELTGSIPPELGDLDSLKILFLNENAFSDSIPPELGNMSSMVELYLNENEFSGSIPSELGQLSKLVRLDLQKNNLSGSIPPELGELGNLKELRLFENALSGSIPSELGQLSNLIELQLDQNALSGSIPSELGQLSNLVVLELYENELSGSIPPELGQMSSLVDLELDQNGLTGSIPSELGELNNLKQLYLSSNELTGSIPSELGDLDSLEILSLFSNQLTGTIPPELGDLPSVFSFWLNFNELSGSIPAELGQLPKVTWLTLRDNALTGPIPPELGQLSSLTDLDLSDNNLSGTVPPGLSALVNLSELILANNPLLDGLLPRSFMDLTLNYLNILATDVCPPLDEDYQAWLNTIPYTEGLYCSATEIERFALVEFYDKTGGESWTNNDGWGSDSVVSSWYGVTVGDSLVQQLRLPDNGLEGPLPPEIATLLALETLDLADNALTGVFPAPIATIDALDTIEVSDNADMENPLPSRMIEMTGLKSLQYTGTGLCAPPTDSFQEWLDSLDIAEGTTCGNPDSVRLSLPVVYLTQAIQRTEGDVSLLPDRDALLRVFLVGDKEHAFFEPEVFATFTRGGKEVLRVVMPSEQDLLPTMVDEGSVVKSYNAVIPAEHIVEGTSLVVVADSAEVIPRASGSQTRYPETGSAALDVIEVPPMELTVVPVLEAEDPDSSVFEWTDGINEDSWQVGQFKHSYPLSEFSASSWDTAYVTSLDLTDHDDQWNLVLELEKVRTNEDATGYWYGAALSNNGWVRGIAQLNGWVAVGKPEGPELAHEVGHTLNLKHVPCGDPEGLDPDFPYPDGSIGVWGYDFRDSSLVSPRDADVMGYCYSGGLAWLSDYHFEKVITAREEKEGEGGEQRKGSKGQMLVLWGGVVNGELRIEPVHPMFTRPKLPEGTGPYRLEGLGRRGEAEFSLSFTPGEDVYGNKYFFFTIPIEGDWENSLERITLTGPEGEVTVDSGDRRSIAIVTDPSTGRIRAILRDWDGPLPAVLGDTRGLEVETTRGIAEAVRLR